MAQRPTSASIALLRSIGCKVSTISGHNPLGRGHAEWNYSVTLPESFSRAARTTIIERARLERTRLDRPGLDRPGLSVSIAPALWHPLAIHVSGLRSRGAEDQIVADVLASIYRAAVAVDEIRRGA